MHGYADVLPVSPPPSRATRRRPPARSGSGLGLAGFAALALMLLAPAPVAAQWQAIDVKWTKYGCYETAEGYRSIGTAKTTVKQVPKTDKVYYQEVKVQIDREVGYAGGSWRQVASKTYDWARFTYASLPTYSKSAVRTGLQPNYGNLSAKVTVWLMQKRRGPDKVIWRIRHRSPTFTCIPVGIGQ